MTKTEFQKYANQWITIERSNGVPVKGYVDPIGIHQDDESVLVSDRVPVPREKFKGIKIKMSDILNVIVNTQPEKSF